MGLLVMSFGRLVNCLRFGYCLAYLCVSGSWFVVVVCDFVVLLF